MLLNEVWCQKNLESGHVVYAPHKLIWAVIFWSLALGRRSRDGKVTSEMYISFVGILAYFHLSCLVLGITERMGVQHASFSGEVPLHSFWAHSKGKLRFLFFLSLCSHWLSLFLIFPSSSLAFFLLPLSLSHSVFPSPCSHKERMPQHQCCREGSAHTKVQALLHADKALLIGNAKDESWSAAAAPLEIRKCCG